jgi:hypothetical protein
METGKRRFQQMWPITIKYTKWPKNIPNGHRIDQMDIKYVYQLVPLQVPQKFTQSWIFGLKICHLATLVSIRRTKAISANPCS